MNSEPSFWIRDIPVFGDVLLAPMAGFSDIPHRAICRRFGSAMSYTEFVAVEEILHGSKKAFSMLDFTPEDRPVASQIFGNNPQKILDAAQRVEELGPDIIDVNMGCSVRNVSGRGAGAGLLRDIKKLGKIIQVLSSNLDIPVSAKIRLGWDQHSKNHLDIAKAIEDNGLSDSINIESQGGKQVYSVTCSRENLNTLLAGLGDVWERFDSATLFVETKTPGMRVVVDDVSAQQIIALITPVKPDLTGPNETIEKTDGQPETKKQVHLSIVVEGSE